MSNKAATSLTFWLLLTVAAFMPSLSPGSWVFVALAYGLKHIYRNDYN